MARNTQQKSTEDTATDAQIPSVADPATQQVERHREVDDLVLEVMRQKSAFSEDELRAAQSFEDFANLTATKAGGIKDVSDVIGDGFTVLSKDEKGILVGVPVIFMEWDFYEGKFGRPFVACYVAAKLPGGVVGKYIINDSGAGICEQLAKYTKKTNETRGLFARKGLTRSDYKTEDDKGNEIDATTFYIDTAAVA